MRIAFADRFAQVAKLPVVSAFLLTRDADYIAHERRLALINALLDRAQRPLRRATALIIVGGGILILRAVLAGAPL